MTHIMLSASTALFALTLFPVLVQAVDIGQKKDADNFIKNGDFEDKTGPGDWRPFAKADVTRTTEARRTGKYGLKIANRRSKAAGIIQRIKFADYPKLANDQMYYISCYIQFLNNKTSYTAARSLYRFIYDNKVVRQNPIGILPWQRADGVFHQLAGDIAVPRVGSATPQFLEIYFRVLPKKIDYYLDSCTMTIIEDLGKDWKTKLAKKIRAVRSKNMTITTKLPQGVKPEEAEVKIGLNKHTFYWGTALGANSLRAELKAYFKKMFNWATFTAAMKWNKIEKRRGRMTYRADRSIRWLVKHGYKIRGHALLWELYETNAKWVRRLRGNKLKYAVMRHLTKTLRHYRRKMVVEWDMDNEYLHHQYYEKRIRQRDLSLLVEEMKHAHKVDSKTKLCINDYEVTRNGRMTAAQADLAFRLKTLGAPIGCVGAQSHFKNAKNFRLERFLKRLDVIAAPGLPITLTELSISAPNAKMRADVLEKVLYAAYSNPQVTGVMFWGLGGLVPAMSHADLLHKKTHKPNAAGRVMENFIRNLWQSRYTYSPTSPTYDFKARMFQGEYKFSVYVNGKLIKSKLFTVDPTDKNGENVALEITEEDMKEGD